MELKYIWTKEFRALIDFEFNFCHDGEHQFSYVNESLIILNNPKPQINFGENITNITLIAGQNGSGKSSFCELVLSSTATFVNGSFGYNYFFDGIVCFGDHIFINNKLKINNLEELHQKYKIVLFKDSPFEKMKPEWRNSFIKGGFIYYSNFLDKKSLQRETNLLNISTQFKLLNDAYENIYFSFRNRSGQENEEFFGKDRFSQYESFASQEDYRFLQFILHNEGFVNFMGEHNVIVLSSSYSGNNKFLSGSQQSNRDEISDYFKTLEERLLDQLCLFNTKEEKLQFDSSLLKNIKHQLYKLNVLSAFYKLHKKSISIDPLVIDDFLESFEINSIFYDLDKINQLLGLHKRLVEIGELDNNFDVMTSRFRNGKALDWRFYLIENTHIKFSSESCSLLKDFMRLEREVLKIEKGSPVRVSNYIIYPYLSSGEFSFMSMFSRLYDSLINYNIGYDYRDKVILFLDEPDVGFHPNWSKNLIDTLLNFLNNLELGLKFQLIITTHSPYMLSDLPKSNIRLFKRDKLLSPRVVESKSDTFGANIYDLLADSFFMQDGFIGEYAKNTIDDVYKDILAIIEKNSNHKPKYSEQEIKSIIEIIGEPLMQRQLSSLYDMAFENKNLEVDIIQRQIDKLQKLKDSKKNNNDFNI